MSNKPEADNLDRNYDKGITQDDVQDMVDSYTDIDDLKSALTDYFYLSKE